MTTSTIKRRRSPSSKTTPHGTTSSNNMSSSDTSVITKTSSEEESETIGWDAVGSSNYINPFIHRVNIDNNVDLAKIYVLTVLLVPIRVVGCVLSLLSAWMFACIGLYGTTVEEINKRPITGWRKSIQYLVAGAMRMLYTAGSFHYITYKGKRASAKEAPILVVAPHSSYVDSIIVAATGPPAIVAKKETSEIPLLGKVINYAQPIYVQREDQNSRQTTINQIIERARSDEDWPQVVIFAEGTCTNRQALIKFKGGAFYPGVPVQPVLLRYPNKYDTFTWTWDGPGVFHLLWLTMATFYNRCEIEYLPVYVPSEKEKADPNLYAKNVRAVMAKSLNIPTSEYCFEDVIMMSRARDLKIPISGDIIEIENTLHKLNLITSDCCIGLTDNYHNIPNSNELDIITLSELLRVDLKNPNLHHLFSVFDYRHVGTVNLKNIILCGLFCKLNNVESIEFLRAIKNLYSKTENITSPEFVKLFRHSGKSISANKIEALFVKIDKSSKGHIQFDDFDNYCRVNSQYKFLYKKHDYIRRKLIK